MIPVEIFTTSQRLRGQLDTRQHRVVDALNTMTESFIMLHEVELTQLTGSLNAVQPLAVVKLAKRAICFAVPQDVEEDDPQRRQQRFFSYTPKDARPVLICLENFEVRGDIHVPRGPLAAAAAREIVDLPGGEFVPVTAATVVFLPRPTLVFQAGVLVLNRAQVTVAGLVPPPRES